MQCPTCGHHTPGTLGTCSNCDAPIDVYSAGPATSPPRPADGFGPPPGQGDAFGQGVGDPTLAAPPPAPSWSTPPTPLSAPTAPPQAGAPLYEASSPAPEQAPLHDPESTAAWTFDPDADPPTPQAGTPAPAWNSAPPAPTFGSLPVREPEAPESIVPESWFAQPRRPSGDTGGTQILPPQPGGPAMDGATQITPGPMMGGVPQSGAPFGMNPGFDQTRLDQPRFGEPRFGGPQFGGPQFGGPQFQQGPMGPPMGPGGFAPPPSGGRAGNGPSKPLLAAVGALVTVAVVTIAFVAWPSGGDPASGAQPSASSSGKQQPVAQKNPISAAARAQAAAMNAVLTDSHETRRVLARALAGAGKCKTLPAAIQGFQTVAQRRQNQIQRTQNLKLDRLAGGERLRGSLRQALQASLDVDRVLLVWAQQTQGSCRGKPRPSAAQVPGRAAHERRATLAKKQFVTLWNPVAKDTGQPRRAWTQV
ncbi:hypothetical protein [Spirillospora albida]|uniref:hypothetical protein n=1 Tax=Spirillospora albida TaxID=58123 RepID=UPI0004C1F7F1|nr:hypothetical protein [Spirillospora albida]